MRFLADEVVDRSVVDGLRKLDFDVFYVLESTRSLDDDILLIALNREINIFSTCLVIATHYVDT